MSSQEANMNYNRAATVQMEAIKASLLALKRTKSVEETKVLVRDLSEQFHFLGWFPGTGGSMTIKVHEDEVPKQNQIMIMTPSGVQKERMKVEDLCVLSSDASLGLIPSPKPFPQSPPKFTESAAVFFKIYQMTNAGAVIHSHAMESCIVTMIYPDKKEFRMKDMEMIKGIEGHGFNDEIVVPIIENASHESFLVEPLTEAIRAYPKTRAVLVRNHGVFIWGDSWITAKTQAECYHYLFEIAIRLHELDVAKIRRQYLLSDNY